LSVIQEKGVQVNPGVKLKEKSFDDELTPIDYPASGIRHQTSPIAHLVSHIPHPVSIELLPLPWINQPCMITIKTFPFNPFMVNTYLLFDETLEAIVVDAGCSDRREEKELEDFVTKHSLKLVRNINTHCHIDHILGNLFLEERYGLKPEHHPAGEPFLLRAKEIGAAYGFSVPRIPAPGPALYDGEVIAWGKSELKVLYTPGHADGSCCLYSKEQSFVLTGDVLFRDSIGRTDLPSGDFDLLMRSIHEKLFTLPDHTIVYPGHGPETTIGYEKLNNPFIG